MSYVVAALVIVGAVALLNLLLTLGLIRRLREYAAVLSDVSHGLGAHADPTIRPVGTVVEPFHTEAVDGTPIDVGWFDKPTLVGFFSPGCQPCGELIPRFVAAAAAGTRTLAVIEPGPVDDSDYRAALAGHTTVVAGAPARSVIAAFGVDGFPAACEVDAGVITAVGTKLVDRAAQGDPQPGRV